MFVILTYDVGKKRVGKALKICRQYLTRVQNSVFEGEITEAKLKKLKHDLSKIIQTNEDGIRIYRLNSTHYANLEVVGIVTNTDNII